MGFLLLNHLLSFASWCLDCADTLLLQMLVYENYNKFITATDTIKLMSASMEGMDSRMDQLNALIGGWAPGCFCALV